LRTLGVTDLTGMDPDKERRDCFETELAGRTFANEVQAIEEMPDLVFICSPNRFHLRQATLAAEKGRFCPYGFELEISPRFYPHEAMD
ncbi:MAG: hypothetical protein L3J21_12460, partial [Devosiaceae bacterium]|nr:hypothetical protein [Devosiaceae bacterium]